MKIEEFTYLSVVSKAFNSYRLLHQVRIIGIFQKVRVPVEIIVFQALFTPPL